MKTDQPGQVESGELMHKKDELGALIVHELRNPLAAILTNASFLRDSTRLHEDDRAVVLDILSAAEAMSRMVMNLVELQRSEDGALVLHLQSIEPGRLAGDVVESMDRHAEQREQRVVGRARGAAGPFVADYELVRRVLENLVDNSLKYAPHGTEIEIEFEPVEGAVEFRVSDRGPVVPEPQRARAFEKYAPLEPGAGHAGRPSRAIGLAYCRAVVEAHGGTISAGEGPTGEAQFVVRLPLSPDQRSA